MTAKKKRGVISGRWKATSPDDSSDPKVRMALRWLLKNNPLYRKYFDMHKKLLDVNVGDTKSLVLYSNCHALAPPPRC